MGLTFISDLQMIFTLRLVLKNDVELSEAINRTEMYCRNLQLDGCQQAQIQYRQNCTPGSPLVISTNVPAAVYDRWS